MDSVRGENRLSSPSLTLPLRERELTKRQALSLLNFFQSKLEAEPEDEGPGQPVQTP